jgi:hypothetical protein
VMEPRGGPPDRLELRRISAREEREYSTHGHMLPKKFPRPQTDRSAAMGLRSGPHLRRL